jgi:hypothetical protein
MASAPIEAVKLSSPYRRGALVLFFGQQLLGFSGVRPGSMTM